MTSERSGASSSDIAQGYTYWGQFIDHDITAGTDRSHEFTISEPDFEPVAPADVEKDIENMRTPFLDLDSVYGDERGPFGENASLYVHNGSTPTANLKVGTNDPASGRLPDPELGNERDLPRNTNQEVFPERPETIANIGDLRNDENLIIAQFHLSFIKFYNRVVELLRANDASASERDLYIEARKQTKFHYQWLVVNDFLQTICGSGAVNQALRAPDFFEKGKVFMPLEFSTAVYRFGHSMVRNEYDFNRNFGRAENPPGGENPLVDRAGFDLLFSFTGKGAIENPRFNLTLPENWVIEWDRFFDITGLEQDEDGNLITDRFARRIDTFLALPLSNMANEDERFLSDEERDRLNVTPAVFNSIMKHLARRNLLRGYLLSMPTGQALARSLNIPRLIESDLLRGNSEELNLHLKESGFLKHTPLWYYVLKESEITVGDHLGPLGAYIIAQTIVGLILAEPHSYLNDGWDPDQGIVRQSGDAFEGIMDFLRFGQVALPPAVMA